MGCFFQAYRARRVGGLVSSYAPAVQAFSLSELRSCCAGLRTPNSWDEIGLTHPSSSVTIRAELRSCCAGVQCSDISQGSKGLQDVTCLSLAGAVVAIAALDALVAYAASHVVVEDVVVEEVVAVEQVDVV